jgi:hypothetical protein
VLIVIEEPFFKYFHIHSSVFVETRADDVVFSSQGLNEFNMQFEADMAQKSQRMQSYILTEYLVVSQQISLSEYRMLMHLCKSDNIITLWRQSTNVILKVLKWFMHNKVLHLLLWTKVPQVKSTHFKLAVYCKPYISIVIIVHERFTECMNFFMIKLLVFHPYLQKACENAWVYSPMF